MDDQPSQDRMEVKLSATRPAGSPVLDGFPLLVYAPGQHGPGVRTEDVGASVDEISAASRSEPDHERLAARFGTTKAHVRQALAHAIMHEDS